MYCGKNKTAKISKHFGQGKLKGMETTNLLPFFH